MYVDALVPRLGVGLDVVVPVFEATLRRLPGFAHLGQPPRPERHIEVEDSEDQLQSRLLNEKLGWVENLVGVDRAHPCHAFLDGKVEGVASFSTRCEFRICQVDDLACRHL